MASRIMVFEGQRIREDWLRVVRHLDGKTMIARQVAVFMGWGPGGSTTDALGKLVEQGLLSVTMQAVVHSRRYPSVRAYTATDKGRRAILEATPLTVEPKQKPKPRAIQRAELEDDEAPVPWPSRDYDAIVAHAISTQPASVFDLSRVM